MPKVSVIVPVYNVEKYLRECVDSILAQTFADFELILVNDGSPDSSGAICDEYALKDSRVKVIHKENGGVSSARNAGLDIACGEYIYFCDSDDTIDNNLLEVCVKTIEEQNVDIVRFGYDIPATNKAVTFLSKNTLINTTSSQEKFSFICEQFLRYQISWETCFGFFKRSIINEHNIRYQPYNKVHAEDMLFSLEYHLYANFVYYLNITPYHYRTVQTSLTHTTKPLSKLNEINELSVYLYNKLTDSYLKDNFCELHWRIIFHNQLARFHFSARKEHLAVLKNALDSISNKEFFIKYNKLYFRHYKKFESKKDPLFTRWKKKILLKYICNFNLSRFKFNLIIWKFFLELFRQNNHK